MYQVVKDEGLFHIRRGIESVRTPAGNPVSTEHESLAQKLAEHFSQYGVDHDHNCSIAMFHASMLDFISVYPKEKIVQQLYLDYDQFNDWTLRRNGNGKSKSHWREIFGDPQTRMIEGRQWLSSLNLNQLCATFVLSRVVLSVNIAWLVANALEQKQLCALVRNVTIYNPILGQLALEELFDNFLFYYRLG